MVYSNTTVYMGGNEYGKSGHLFIFYFFEALNDVLEVRFSGLHFYTLSKTLITCRAMQLKFLKVATLLKPQDSFGRLKKKIIDLQKVDHTIR